MNHKQPPRKIIRITDKIAGRNDAAHVNRSPSQQNDRGARVMAVTSGKGGVGKTNIVANLGYALTRLGQRVLLLDADMGLGNIDVLLGKAPRYNLSHVIAGEKNMDQVILEGPGGMSILPASSGIDDMTRLSPDQRGHILQALDGLMDSFDMLLIDTAAGISSNVMYFNVSADDIIVVATPEPTSITDAYALMKVLSMKYAERRFKLLVNMAPELEDAKEVYRQLSLVAGRFLDIELVYAGCILRDEGVGRCVMRQRVLTEMDPESRAGRCFMDLARSLAHGPAPSDGNGRDRRFWKLLLENKFERQDRN
ncbi:MAG: MinD/ParA family protein [Desulfobacterales bacterium]|nr:MinD/ParA family protein [Desulfobacterales bacterium]